MKDFEFKADQKEFEAYQSRLKAFLAKESKKEKEKRESKLSYLKHKKEQVK